MHHASAVLILSSVPILTRFTRKFNQLLDCDSFSHLFTSILCIHSSSLPPSLPLLIHFTPCLGVQFGSSGNYQPWLGGSGRWAGVLCVFLNYSSLTGRWPELQVFCLLRALSVCPVHLINTLAAVHSVSLSNLTALTEPMGTLATRTNSIHVCVCA